ncbi:MAG: hypothetical protein WKH64_07650 [Chloroflexia bacterium]
MNSGEAVREYGGFHTVLFVTTGAAWERLIMQALLTASSGWDLPVLLTTTSRIAESQVPGRCLRRSGARLATRRACAVCQ